MRVLLTTLFLALALAGAQGQDAAKKAEAAKKEMEALEGTWVAVAATRDGEKSAGRSPADNQAGLQGQPGHAPPDRQIRVRSRREAEEH